MKLKKNQVLAQAHAAMDSSNSLDRFGCAIVFYGQSVSKAEVDSAVLALSKENLMAVPAYKEDADLLQSEQNGTLEILFVYPEGANTLIHPKRVNNLGTPGSDGYMAVNYGQLALLLTALLPLGWRLVSEDHSGFKLAL